MEGPCQSKKYEIRLDKILLAIPVAVYVGAVFTVSPQISDLCLWDRVITQTCRFVMQQSTVPRLFEPLTHLF